MNVIEQDLNQLLKEREKANAAVTAASDVIKESQIVLSDAKARQNEAIQRLGPLQQLAKELEASRSAVEKHRQSIERDIKEAEKLYKEVFPAVEKEVSTEKRKALEAADTAIRDLDHRISALRIEVDK